MRYSLGDAIVLDGDIMASTWCFRVVQENPLLVVRYKRTRDKYVLDRSSGTRPLSSLQKEFVSDGTWKVLKGCDHLFPEKDKEIFDTLPEDG